MPDKESELVKSQMDVAVDEIELTDLLRVIWKWKYLIIGGSIVFTLAAAIISFSQTKIYKVDTIIEPGIVNIITAGLAGFMSIHRKT